MKEFYLIKKIFCKNVLDELTLTLKPSLKVCWFLIKILNLILQIFIPILEEICIGLASWNINLS